MWRGALLCALLTSCGSDRPPAGSGDASLDGAADGGGDAGAARDGSSPGSSECAAPPLTERWAVVLDGSDYREVVGMAADDSGVLIGVNFDESVEVGGETFTAGADVPGAVVVRFDDAGAVRWTVPLTPPGGARLADVAIGPGGTIYAAGELFDTLSLPGGESITTRGRSDGFLIALDDSGALRWLEHAGGAERDAFTALSAGGGRVAAAGTFAGEAILGGTARTAPTAVGAFVQALSSEGVTEWVQIVDGEGFDQPTAVGVGSDGGVRVAGRFSHSVEVGGETRTGQFEDVFLAALAADGAPMWSRVFGAAREDLAPALIPTPDGGAALAGRFHGEVDFGGGALSSCEECPSDGTDAFVASYSGGGAHRWSAGFGSDAQTWAQAAALAGDQVLVGGAFTFLIELGGHEVRATPGRPDAFVATFALADGAPSGLWCFGDDGWDELRHMAVGSDGSLVLAGTSDGFELLGSEGGVPAGPFVLVLER